MGLVLKLLGVVFLLLIAAVVVIVLVVRARLRRFVRNLEDAASRSAASPPRVRLVPMVANDWNDGETVGDLIDPLHELGFESAGEFEVREVPGMRLQGLVKPSEAVTAVVYEHPRAGVWLDLSTTYDDGTRITYANTHHGAGDRHPPGHRVERFPGLGAKALYQKLLTDRPQKPASPATAAGFATAFEASYADEMAWRAGRGGADNQPAVIDVTPDPGRALEP